MSFMKTILGTGTLLAISATVALAEPAIVYDIGGKFDKSFNETASHGAEKWAKETGKKFREITITSAAQREQAIRRLAENGNNPIVMTGFAFASPLNTVAKEFPKTKFVIVDSIVKLPNVRSVVFKEQEGSYLVGVAAAKASKSGVVGFIGGMDIPLIRKFACGYVQGVKATAPKDKVIQNMTGVTPAAWNNPVKGAELAKAQIAQGADVIYAAAGGTGVGVLQAAADAGIYSIGVDSNQNYLHPGSVLTSMVKRVDVAVYNAFKAGPNLKPGVEVMGLANGGISYALDKYNAKIFTPAIRVAVEAAKKGIMDGKIKVHNYMTNNSCPVK